MVLTDGIIRYVGEWGEYKWKHCLQMYWEEMLKIQANWKSKMYRNCTDFWVSSSYNILEKSFVVAM